MADSRRRTAKDLPDAVRDTGDAVREAVERTVQATVGSAQEGAGRAQGVVDDFFKSAEANLRESGRAVGDRVREALPATQDDLNAMRAELREVVRRLDAIEKRLPGKTKE